MLQGEGDLDNIPENGVGCAPADNDSADPCFVSLRDHEVLKRREWRTDWRNASGLALREVDHSFMTQWYLGTVYDLAGYVDYPNRGLWRGFTFESQTDERTCEQTTAACDDPLTTTIPPLDHLTKYFYDPVPQNGTQYGDLTRIQEYDGTTLVRDTRRSYATRDIDSWSGNAPTPSYTESYLVDRVWQEAIYDGTPALQAWTVSFYDNMTTANSVSAVGELWRVMKFYDAQQVIVSGTVMHSRDMTYAYDSFGNRTGETTYAGAGTATYNGSAWSYSAPGNGSAARTTTTAYNDAATSLDESFSGLPVKVQQPPAIVGATPLAEQAVYDYRLGVLTSVTDPNGNVTSAQYDIFGRMIKLIKPGDSTTFPTVQATYDDLAQPFRYEVDRRELAGVNGAVRPIQTFYDGLGRKIQTKTESANGSQNIIVDMRYDALGRVTAASQPHYVNESGAAFTAYTNPGVSLNNPTTTTYDMLGRVGQVTRPDGLRDQDNQYGTWQPTLGIQENWHVVVDANRHLTQYFTDALGRSKRVREFTGNCSTDGSWGYTCGGAYTTPWAFYADTNYTYSALDLLTQVKDGATTPANTTTMTYDTLGRKLTMNDPDMGAWSYTYDANGNLARQTDARGQRVCFYYDALDRLTGKHYNGTNATCPASPTTMTYTYDAGTNGKSQRTGMSSPDETTSWTYDARGRKTGATHTVPGLTGTRVFGWTYDSADRLATQTYPTVGSVIEQLTYSYDPAWRPTQVCSNRTGAPCYANTATYTALDQPLQWNLNNTLIQKWTYVSPLQRLSRLQVGTVATPGSIFDRGYGYDSVGNVKTIIDNKLSPTQTQNFNYDERDRLTQAWTTGNAANSYNESYTYNNIGNLTNKAGTVYTYPAAGSARPHTPTTVGGTSYLYDANGNLSSGNGRNYTWNAENLPTTISYTGGSENYSYDADGERVKVVNGSTTTVYLEGVWDEVVGGTTKVYYPFNGQMVALRDTSANTVTYLHADHLGSISVATNSSGLPLNSQEFDPWGKLRLGAVSQTSRNYTGQILDGSKLLYYHARMYDPGLGRFVSPDTVVPGSASGSMDGVALKPLTVDFHEPGFVASLNSEASNDKLYWGGPMNPQALNRYSYVLNNPMRWTDPRGHAISISHREAFKAYLVLDDIIEQVQSQRNLDNGIVLAAPAIAGSIVGLAMVSLASAILGISITVGGVVISPDSLGIDFNGNLENLTILKSLKAELRAFGLYGSDADTMTIWATSTSRNEVLGNSACNGVRCWYPKKWRTRSNLNWTWGGKEPVVKEVSRSLYEEFVHSTGADQSGGNMGPH